MAERARWQLAGNAAEIYQRELVPALFGPWGQRVVELAALRPGLRVLDVACGTGLVARLAAEAVGVDGRVTALDVNPAMLAVAAELPAVEGAPIDWVEGNAQVLPFAEASFDVGCGQLGIQFFPDREGALREMKRVLVPSGRAVVMVWRETTAHPALRCWPRRWAERSVPTRRLMRAPFALGDAGELARLLEAGGPCDCAILAETGTVRFASAATFVRSQVGRSPPRRGRRRRTVTGLRRARTRGRGCPRPLIEQGSLCFPIEAHLALCRA